MKINKKYIQKIRNRFSLIQNKYDLIDVLNYTNKILYKTEFKQISLRSLTYYSMVNSNDNIFCGGYKEFTIQKKSGEMRFIYAPTSGLKNILRTLNLILQCVFEPHVAATGFVLNKSIVDNAKTHIGNHYVYNIDLKNFFYSFNKNRVKLSFMFEPFNLNGNREPLAYLLANLCTNRVYINIRENETNKELIEIGKCFGIQKNGYTFINFLPQGSPTSPTITNIICKKLDKRFSGLAKRFSAKYTRYADDITFSSPHNIYKNEEFIKEMEYIISTDNLLKESKRQIGPKLTINTKKTRLQKSAYRQEVTGLVVNKKINVRRRYIKKLRMWLYYWEKYGYDKANNIFNNNNIKDKSIALLDSEKKTIKDLKQVLSGKLEFIKMVKGSEDSTYIKLKQRFDKLTEVKKKVKKFNRQKKGILKKPKLPKPEETKNFLINFQESASIKFLTHRFIEKISHKDFISNCKKDFKKLKKKYPNTQKEILELINNYAFKKNPKWYNWNGNENIEYKTGWSEKKFVEWYKRSPNLHPIDNKDWKKNLILPFKNSIEVRSGSLDKIFNNTIENTLKKDFTINKNKEELNIAHFYTDTNRFQYGLKHIFNTIKDYAAINLIFEININYSEVEKFKIIKIIHVNSEPSKNSSSILGGDLKTIKSFFWGLCNYEIEACFPDGNKKIYVLNDNLKSLKNTIIELNEKPKGFTHILKFY